MWVSHSPLSSLSLIHIYGEKYELILSPEGLRSRLFPLVYFQQQAPESVLAHWNIRVGRQPAPGFLLRTGEIEIRVEDVQMWAEKTEDQRAVSYTHLAPFEVHALVRKWTEAQRAETLDAEKAIAFSENLRRQSRWGEIDYYLLGLLEQELQEKYFVVTGREDDHRWSREYSLKPGIRAEEVPEPLLRFACYVAVSYKVYGMEMCIRDRLTGQG